MEMKLGVPKEIAPGETRVAATPETVGKLRAMGLDVVVENDAGIHCHYTDDAYRQAGADIVDRAQALAADIILKIHKPLPNEIRHMKRGAVLIALLDTHCDDGTLGFLAEQGVDSFALERMPRLSRAQSMDVLSSQSNIAGYRAVLEAAWLYGRFFPMMMTSAGSAKPARVVVLGAGVAGLQAIATARRLGARVWAYDVRPEVKEQVQSLGARFIDLGEADAGESSADDRARQQRVLTEELKKADVVISTALIPGKPAPILVTEEAVKGMRPGTIVVDLAAVAGGNCPLTEAGRMVIKHGVILCGYINFPACMPGDASDFFARNACSFLQLILDGSSRSLRFKNYLADEITGATLVTHRGNVCVETTESLGSKTG